MKENKMSNKSEKEIIKKNMLTLYKAHQEGEKIPLMRYHITNNLFFKAKKAQ